MSPRRLGQHWLFDQPSLKSVVNAGDVSSRDIVLEVGPGLGSLTELLVAKAMQVVAVEKDERLAVDLERKLPADNLEIVTDDIMQYDLRRLPKDYKVIANIPYYLTSNVLRLLLESVNPPLLMSLLLQKEVAERIAAGPGRMSVLAISVQYYAETKLIQQVPKELFSPPPKVDSAIIQIRRRGRPSFEADPKKLFRLVKAGFGEKRKQLKNTLAGGLHLTPEKAEATLKEAKVDKRVRAQDLGLADWYKLYKVAEEANIL